MDQKNKDSDILYEEAVNFLYKSYKQQDEYYRSTKYEAIFLGGKSVGKTSIISAFRDQSFNQNIEPTKGINYYQLSYYHKKYDKYFGYSTWDTSGDKIYRPLIQNLLKKAQVFILVYDITRKETFNELREYWIHEIKKYITSKSGKLLFFYSFIIL